MLKKTLCIFICLLLAFSLPGCGEKKSSSTEFAMNTVISITAYGENSKEAVDAAFKEIRRTEKLLSCHIEDSEISKINKGAFFAPVEVSEETASVLKKALMFCEKSLGAFDITVKPLADLWNIKAENPKVPSDGEILSVLEKIGYENVYINGNAVSFAKEGIELDLGGAAKGYAADRAVKILKEYKIKNAILDLGGNVYALGKNEQGKDWRIGLQDPGQKRGSYFSMQEISGLSAVTSGSYERYFEKDGRIYHHIFDPLTGKCADKGLISVTVIAENSFEADMLSTLVFVMGEDKFMEVKDEFNYKRIITVDKNNSPRTFEKGR